MDEQTNEYIVFRIFKNEEDAEFFTSILTDAGVDFRLEHAEKTGDNVITGSFGENQSNYFLMIRQSDFEKARIELQKSISEYFESAGNIENSILNDFSNDELKEVLTLPDEWSEEDIVAAQKILEKRGIPVSNEEIESLRKKREEIVRQPRFTGWFNIIIGYIFSLAGGIIGIIIAASLMGKKRIFTGEKVYEYDQKTRLHAFVMLVISFIVIIAAVIYWCLK